MAKFPFTVSYSEARSYYGPSLESSKNPPESWSNYSQQPTRPVGNQLTNFVAFGAVVGGIAAAGYLPVGKKGKHVWDYYVGALRGFEEYSPAKFLRTFQASTILSPFQTNVRQANLFISPESLQLNKQYTEYLSKVVGPGSYQKLLQKGATLKQGSLYWGQGSDVALKYATAITTPGLGETSRIGAAYARRLGVKQLRGSQSFDKFFAAKEPSLNKNILNPAIGESPAQIIGGKTFAQHQWRKMGALGTEQVERFNRLLKMTPKIGKYLGVRSRGGLRTMGALGLKYGLGLSALSLAYETLDWKTRQSETLDKTMFDKGLTYGLASIPVGGHILAADVSESLGLQSFARKQEEIAPGSTDLLKLAAFPTIGALGVGSTLYAARVAGTARLQISEGLSVSMASERMGQAFKTWDNFGAFGKGIGEFLQRQGGRLAKVSPTKLGVLAGAGLGLAAVLPFLPGALIPQTSSEELKDIYLGKQEAAIRRGRWWELGRCNTAESLIFLDSIHSKKACDVCLKDTLLGSDGESHSIKGIYSRKYKGEALCFSTVLDRNIETGLTPNHIVPVLEEYSGPYYINKNDRDLIFKEAKDIKVGDYVQIPISKLPDNLYLINNPAPFELSQSIKIGDYLIQEDKIVPAQINWFTKNIQRSNGNKIPNKIFFSHRLGRLIGYFLAEGNLSFKNDVPAFIETVHAMSEEDIVSDIRYICNSVFGINITERIKTTGKKNKEGCRIIRICSSLLAKIFFEWFYDSNRSTDKHMPNFVFKDGDQSFRHGIVLGYWRGDGHMDRGRPVISSSRKSLIDDMKLFLLDLGYHPTVPKIEYCNYIKKDDEIAEKYRIGWNANPEEWGYNTRTTQGYIEKYGKVFVRVISINSKEYDGIVYDFEIDHEDHLLKNGSFLVHNSPYEGSSISYFRPHAYSLLGSRAREKGIWGEDYETLNPLERWYKSNFTYELEAKHYEDRPYPVSGLPFQDVPFFGPILSATVGKLFKPQLYMHCFSPDTLIRLENGWKTILDVNIGDMIVSGFGNHKKVLNKFINVNNNDDAVSLSTGSALEDIKVTKGHYVYSIKAPLCTQRGKGRKHQFNSQQQCYCSGLDLTPQWIQVGDLEKYDYIVQRRPAPSLENFNIQDYVDEDRWRIEDNIAYRKTPNNWPNNSLEIDIDDWDWGRLLGLYAAEGTSTKNGVSFAFHIKETKFADYVKSICEKISPANKTSLYFKEDTNSLVVNCSSTFLKDLLVEVHGMKKNKELNPSDFSEEFMVGYIQGIFDGDGYFPDKDISQNNVLTNTRHSLIKTTQRFLMALGIAPKIYKTFNQNKQDCYQLYIRKCEWDYLIDGSKLKYKNSPHDFIFNDYVYCRITKIQPISLSITIDIEIDIDHSYLVDDFIVHNSEEWLSDQGIKSQPPGFGARIATEVGQTVPGTPIAPAGLGQVVGEEIYRLGTEMIGFTGFTAAAIKEKITGSQDWFDQTARLEDAGRITSYEREYWDKELGGLAGFSEAWRRLFPHRRRQIDLVNPIRNTMSDWLPGAGEKGPNLLFGDPYTKIPYGETRLPGPGLDVLYPELKGVDPEDYSASWKHKILGDVAPYTDKYKEALQEVRSERNRSGWTEDDEARFQTTLEQVKTKKQKTVFQEYKYLSAMGNISSGTASGESSDLMATMNEWKASQEEKPSLFSKTFGGYWELLAHNAESAWGQLTPISPGAKLVHTRSPIESYEREILYGQSAAFWQHPISHFVEPFGRSMARAFGYKGVPEASQTTRDIESYFDTLTYIKNSRLANLARIAGDTKAVKEFENNKNETLFGINPFTRNYRHVLRALPRRERDYLSAFEKADTIEERERILEMVPENEKELYVARWKLAHADELKKAMKAGVLTKDQVTEAERHIERVYKDAKSEGFPTSEDLMSEYLQTKQPGEGYADWYRRVKILGNVQNIPGPDWCLPAGVEIIEDNLGLSKVESVIIGDMVYQGSGVNKVIQRYIREVDEDIYSIKVQNDNVHQMSATEGHSVLILRPSECNYKRVVGYRQDSNLFCVPRGNKQCLSCSHKTLEYEPEFISIDKICLKTDYLAIKTFVPFKEIKKFDLVELSKHNKIRYDNIDIWVYYNDKKSAAVCNKVVEADTDFCWLLGYYAAEGNLKFRNLPRAVCLTQNLSEELFADKVESIVSKYGLNLIRKERFKDTGNSRVLTINNIPFAELIHKLLPGNAHSKHLTDMSIFSSLGHIEAFIAGLFGGDSLKDESRARLEIASYRLALLAKELLLSLGVSCSFRRVVRGKYKVSFSYSQAKELGLFQEINLCSGKQAKDSKYKASLNGCFCSNGYAFFKVIDIEEKNYKGSVYNFGIENIQEYRGIIGTYHNCGWHPSVDLEDVKLKLVQHLGEEAIPLNLWPSREKELPYKPYINDEIIKPIISEETLSSEEIKSRVNRLMFADKIEGDVFLSTTRAGQQEVAVNIEIEQDRTEEEERLLVESLNA